MTSVLKCWKRLRYGNRRLAYESLTRPGGDRVDLVLGDAGVISLKRFADSGCLPRTKSFAATVDTLGQGCRIRISFEGHADFAGRKSADNRLKTLEILSTEFLLKAVDRQAIRCRIRGLDQGTSFP